MALVLVREDYGLSGNDDNLLLQGWMTYCTFRSFNKDFPALNSALADVRKKLHKAFAEAEEYYLLEPELMTAAGVTETDVDFVRAWADLTASAGNGDAICNELNHAVVAWPVGVDILTRQAGVVIISGLDVAIDKIKKVAASGRKSGKLPSRAVVPTAPKSLTSTKSKFRLATILGKIKNINKKKLAAGALVIAGVIGIALALRKEDDDVDGD
jgi:hypothetical protein